MASIAFTGSASVIKASFLLDELQFFLLLCSDFGLFACLFLVLSSHGPHVGRHFQEEEAGQYVADKSAHEGSLQIQESAEIACYETKEARDHG